MGLTRVLGAALSAALALAAAGPTAAQTVRSVRVKADQSAGDGGADVRVEYRLDAGTGPVSVPFELLGFGDATAEEFRLEAPDSGWALEPASGSRRVATVALPPGPATRTLVARYRVARAVVEERGTLRAHVPLLTVAWPPAAAVPDLFRAAVTLPSGWTVTEGFPTGLGPVPSGAPGPPVYAVDLAVAPSVVSLRGRTDGAWRPGLPLVLDVLALAVIAGFGAAGWAHLRRVVRSAETEAAG